MAGELSVSKYSFHWQSSDGQLLKRWDNAAHHPDVETFPHHVHEGRQNEVRSHHPITAEAVLSIVTTGQGGRTMDLDAEG